MSAYSSLLLLLLMPVMLVSCCLSTSRWVGHSCTLHTLALCQAPLLCRKVAPNVNPSVIGPLRRLQNDIVCRAVELARFVLLHNCPALSTFARTSYDMTPLTTSLRTSGSIPCIFVWHALKWWHELAVQDTHIQMDLDLRQ